MKKVRLDDALVRAGLAPDRDMARRLVMEGRVLYGTERMDAPSAPVADPERLSVKGGKKYVGRGGLKLERAMREFPIGLCGAHCLDIGAATGGFTDCMLQSGAERIYAVDVGYGLLDYSLRADPRVVVMERTNARYLGPESLERLCDFASVDVSFISLSRIFPALAACLREGAQAVALAKPQFEAPKGRVGEGGVVRDPAVHLDVLRKAVSDAALSGLTPIGVTFSPIRGADGNIEFLLYMQKSGGLVAIGDSALEDAVEKAHASLA